MVISVVPDIEVGQWNQTSFQGIILAERRQVMELMALLW
jgi:hypothetical protein